MRRRFSILVLGLLYLAVKASYGQTMDCKKSEPNPRVLVTSQPADTGHEGNTAFWALRGDRRDACQLNPQLDFKDPRLSDQRLGTGISGYLRNGRVIVTRIASNGDVYQYVGSLDTGEVIADPMECVVRGCSGSAAIQPDVSYASGLQAIYDPNDDSKIINYAFTTRNGYPNATEYKFWRVDPNGQPAIRLRVPPGAKNQFKQTGVHGCIVSPDGSFIACQNPHVGEGIEVLPISMGNDGVSVPAWAALSIAVWSPDSLGFAYHDVRRHSTDSRFGARGSDYGAIMYYRLEKDRADPSKLLASQPVQMLPKEGEEEPWIATEFCSLEEKVDPRLKYLGCQHLGMLGAVKDKGEPSSNIGSEMPAWSPDPKYLQLYVAAVDRSSGPKQLVRTLGSIHLSYAADGTLNKVGPFQPLVMHSYKLPAGYPEVSPSGKQIAFLGPTSPSDARSQLYMYDLESEQVTRLTSIQLKNEVYAPHWRPD